MVNSIFLLGIAKMSLSDTEKNLLGETHVVQLCKGHCFTECGNNACLISKYERSIGLQCAPLAWRYRKKFPALAKT
jgi:hypothetical protein